ncbi:MAG: TrkH family potassium uptake protein [Ruminococcaceae bacterium]|nr:TrkH family potassium uptake protein [Oscillospiraceae bacterium]
MNIALIFYIIGRVLQIEALFLLPSVVTALCYGEWQWWVYLATAGSAALLGQLVCIRKPRNMSFFMRDGFAAVALSWVVMSAVGAIPLVLGGDIPSYTDALFETISGFTTTGASILPDVEALSHAGLFWRSLTHWIGGMGVLVFLLAILPMAGGSHMQLMRAESPGPSVGKLVPKVRSTAKILYLIYLAMTAVEIILLLCGGMSLFESLTVSFGTAGTGGFAVKNSSIGSYSPYLQWVITIFMAMFGVNFSVYFLILMKKFRQAFFCEELRWYGLILLGATGLVAWNLYRTGSAVGMSFAEILRHSAFQVSSIMTTTGFATIDFDLWPKLSRCVMVILMFIGACAGSTGGGIKVSRIVILFKAGLNEVRSYVHPRSVRTLKFEGKPIRDEMTRSIAVYFFVFILIFTASVLILCRDGKDLVTNFTAVAATINNIGPGLAAVGPTQNYNSYGLLSKYVLMFDMLAGRLELYPMLLLFYPAMWREQGFCSKRTPQ